MAKWRILGVDNGTSLLGWSLLEYDFTSDTATLLEVGFLEPKLMAYGRHPRLVMRKGNNAARRAWMQTKFSYLLDDLDPDVVAIETPFIGRAATRSSFEPLALSVDGLIDSVLDYEDRVDRWVDIEKVSPHEAKRSVTPPGVKFDSSKEMVEVNIGRHPQILLGDFNLGSMKEDEVDSISVGWTVVTRLGQF